jgi:tRNA pseudouridine38-40 synthase
MLRRIALILEYDGTRYAGFQLQTDRPTIQGAVETAVQRLTGAAARIHGAGRTDAGVHAEGHVACFDSESELPIERIIGGLNHYLARDIAVRAAYDVDVDFDPRRHATSRVYRYTMLEGRARSPLRENTTHHVGRPLDIAAMNTALAMLEGQRDFVPFCGNLPNGSTVRHMYRTQVWRQEGDEVCLEMEASAFMHQQVRRIAGAVVDVGVGKMTIEEFQTLADSGVHGSAAHVLPARGLCLRRVGYSDFPPPAETTATDKTEVMVG